MEESITILEAIRQAFPCEEVDIKTYSPLTLAFIGDGIYSLVIRTAVVERGNRAAEKLHKMTAKLVKAQTQASLVEALAEDGLTEEEAAVYRRGRNAQSHSTAKHASVADYRKATGLEALCGYLYLSGRTERMLFLIKEGLARIGMEI